MPSSSRTRTRSTGSRPPARTTPPADTCVLEPRGCRNFGRHGLPSINVTDLPFSSRAKRGAMSRIDSGMPATMAARFSSMCPSASMTRSSMRAISGLPLDVDVDAGDAIALDVEDQHLGCGMRLALDVERLGQLREGPSAAVHIVDAADFYRVVRQGRHQFAD